MIYGVKPGSETYREEGKGGVFTVTWRCDWSDIVPFKNPELPNYGDSMPGNDYFRVVDIDCKSGNRGDAEVTITYSTERQLAESWCDESIRYGVEPAEDDAGWTWETTGTPVVDPLPRQRPILNISLRIREEAPPIDKVWPALYKVNDRVFRGISAGYLRFDGVSADNSYAIDGTLISVASVYEFSVRSRPFNEAWRRPLQALDIDLNPIFWQNIDVNQPYYTTDPGKIATPVWIHQTPGQTANPAGIANWDKPIKDGDYYYSECDFATVLGLPIKDGDDEGGG